MTDAEVVVEAKALLTALANRALLMHRTKRTRVYIRTTHNHWNGVLSRVECNYQPLSGSVVAAFRELASATRKMVDERGEDPDSILHWLEMFPSLVVNVHLGVPQPNTV